ncbi:hypothetical protein POTOM_057523 [Populus tomentosa]|uniref:Uncharacterized protein n=1 Tax=Populus tomentosa TaxID=118781 RepID=A0A8X7XXU6_POPTO|nr:hypothetical protein POTOM_057523 [Populus tomentosa]
MATGSADGFFRHVYDGCLSGGDMGIGRRPYHRNCRCALHKSKENCPHALPRLFDLSNGLPSLSWKWMIRSNGVLFMLGKGKLQSFLDDR